MRQCLLIILSAILLTACKKEISLNLDDKSGSIVIEGNITNQPGPYFVRITKSVSFTSGNQYPAITNAVVTISDNLGQTETLRYMADGNYKTTNLRGRPGRTYKLTAVINGTTYTAQSTMPQPVPLDSLKQDAVKFGGDINYNVLPLFTDPVVLGNRYLLVATFNTGKKKILTTFSDNINNGMLNQRPIPLSINDDTENEKVKAGDQINIELQCIDPIIYTYYNALIDVSETGGPGGGVTPTNPPSNISNGALGYFSAYTNSTRSITIK